ncbi:hypothetical protein RvY_09514-2 [Ramazzottius varieornatus]|uniref:VWFC domain-containing protein n=1 Tax=Ramazzottius varieornatus TaxID=947166 RepID=A0A1D1V9L1_RAMVA|nr:hypothetical protein RvY_09514-2 [Ramazzottius varieornatus]
MFHLDLIVLLLTSFSPGTLSGNVKGVSKIAADRAGNSLPLITRVLGTAETHSDIDCDAIDCPEPVDTFLECPSDSILLQNSTERYNEWTLAEKCCPFSPRCVCKAEDTCPVPQCATGEKFILTKRGDWKPGSCCDVHACVPYPGLAMDRHNGGRRDDELTTCVYNGSKYHDGSVWSDAGNCTHCHCKNGVSECKEANCPRLHCDHPRVKVGECCPVCEGCEDDSGVVRSDMERWQLSDCVHCVCEKEQIRCNVEECQINCMNPVSVAGQCCPQCADDPGSLILQPAHCAETFLNGCNRLCRHGYIRGSDDCFRCECQIENCSLNCEMGYDKDLVTGEDICQCLGTSLQTVNISASTTPLLQCRNSTRCQAGCTLKIDQRGCAVCSCQEPCPEFRLEDCPAECPRGYQHDNRSCLTCQCLHGGGHQATTGATSEHHELPTTSPRPTQSLSSNGSPLDCFSRRDLDLVPWMEGCHECACLKGDKYCSLRPRLASGEGAKEEKVCRGARTMKFGFCDASRGTYVLSTKWSNLSSCTECICSSGTVYCKSAQCPSLKCAGELVQYEEACCPSCQVLAINSPRIDTSLTKDYLVANRKKVSCQIHDVIQPSGSSWWETPCKACECFDGATRCKEVKCPRLQCVDSLQVWQQGRCCPFCVYNSSAPAEATSNTSKCQSNGQVYFNDERWNPQACTTCVCEEGRSVCEPDPACGGLRENTTVSGHPDETTSSDKTVFIVILLVAVLAAMVLGGVLILTRYRRRQRKGYRSPITSYPDHSASGSLDGSSSTPLKKLPRSLFKFGLP